MKFTLRKTARWLLMTSWIDSEN